MDIFELLKRDHENVLGLFDDLEQMQSKAGKKKDTRQDKLFNQLRQELEVHMDGEEELVYPHLQEEEELHPMVLEAIEEHHVARMLLSELAGMPAKDEQWFAKLAVLRENIEHHVDVEEGELFTSAQELLDNSRRKEMGGRMAEYKEDHIAAPR